jgi:hypothetical protein
MKRKREQYFVTESLRVRPARLLFAARRHTSRRSVAARPDGRGPTCFGFVGCYTALRARVPVAETGTLARSEANSRLTECIKFCAWQTFVAHFQA